MIEDETGAGAFELADEPVVDESEAPHDYEDESVSLAREAEEFPEDQSPDPADIEELRRRADEYDDGDDDDGSGEIVAGAPPEELPDDTRDGTVEDD